MKTFVATLYSKLLAPSARSFPAVTMVLFVQLAGITNTQGDPAAEKTQTLPDKNNAAGGEQLKTAPDHMQAAMALLTKPSSPRDAAAKAIEHLKKAIELSDDPEYTRKIKMQLISVYYKRSQLTQAIGIAEELGTEEPKMDLILSRLYLSNGERNKASRLAKDALRRMDDGGAVNDSDLKMRLDALSFLAAAGGHDEFTKTHLSKLISLVENNFGENKDNLKPLLAKSYTLLGQIMIQDNDQATRCNALVYFDKAISAAPVTYPTATSILYASALSGSKGLSQQHMREQLEKGEAVAVIHIILGLKEWKKDKLDAAEGHFRKAHAHETQSLRVLEYAANDIAMKSKHGKPDADSFSLQKKPDWRKSLELLQTTSKIDPTPLGQNLDAQCTILASQQYWHEIISLLEPNLDKAPKTHRIKFLQMLSKAHTSGGDNEKAQKYNNLLKAELGSE